MLKHTCTHIHSSYSVGGSWLTVDRHSCQRQTDRRAGRQTAALGQSVSHVLFSFILPPLSFAAMSACHLHRQGLIVHSDALWWRRGSAMYDQKLRRVSFLLIFSWWIILGLSFSQVLLIWFMFFTLAPMYALLLISLRARGTYLHLVRLNIEGISLQ